MATKTLQFPDRELAIEFKHNLQAMGCKDVKVKRKFGAFGKWVVVFDEKMLQNENYRRRLQGRMSLEDELTVADERRKMGR
jgi:hypothetical protein